MKIVPGMLCYIRGLSWPFEPNNGKIVEIVKLRCTGIWVICASSDTIGVNPPNSRNIVTIPAGVKSLMDEDYLVPISDPDQELENEIERSTELLQQ